MIWPSYPIPHYSSSSSNERNGIYLPRKPPYALPPSFSLAARKGKRREGKRSKLERRRPVVARRDQLAAERKEAGSGIPRRKLPLSFGRSGRKEVAERRAGGREERRTALLASPPLSALKTAPFASQRAFFLGGFPPPRFSLFPLSSASPLRSLARCFLFPLPQVSTLSCSGVSV